MTDEELCKYIDTMQPLVMNKDNTLNVKVFTELITAVKDWMNDKVDNFSTQKLPKKKREYLEEIKKLLPEVTNKIISLEELESFRLEEEEKQKVMISILKTSLVKLDDYSGKVILLTERVSNILKKYGRDKEYFNLYKKLLSIPDITKSFKLKFDTCVSEGKKYKPSKLNNHFNNVKKLFSELMEIEKLVKDLIVEITEYEKAKESCKTLEQYVKENQLSQDIINEENFKKDNQIRKLFEIKEELDKRKASIKNERGYEVQYKIVK